MKRVILALVLGISSVPAFLTTNAHASCALPPPLQSAIATAFDVFVGTVVELENMRRWATVEVDSIWKGDDIPAEVEVRAGPKNPPGDGSVASSVDRSFRLGKQYLFLPFERKGSVFKDNSCTNTRVFRPGLERLRPANAESPEASPSVKEVVGPPLRRDPDDDDREVLVPLIGGALLLAATGIVLFRRKSST